MEFESIVVAIILIIVITLVLSNLFVYKTFNSKYGLCYLAGLAILLFISAIVILTLFIIAFCSPHNGSINSTCILIGVIVLTIILLAVNVYAHRVEFIPKYFDDMMDESLCDTI